MDYYRKKIPKFTAIGRLIDVEDSTNRLILTISFLASLLGLSWELILGKSFFPSALWGIGAGFAIFFTWALAREIDPEHSLSAFPGIVLTFLGSLILGLPDLIKLLWILIIARMLNRTTGLPAKVTDSLVIVLLTGYLVWQANWLFGFFAAVAFFLDSFLPNSRRRQILFAMIALLASLVGIVLSGGFSPVGHLGVITLLAILVITLLFIPVVIRARLQHVNADFTQETLYPSRVQAAQLTTLATCWLLAIWGGDAEIYSVLPMWSAFLGTSLYGLGVQLFKR